MKCRSNLEESESFVWDCYASLAITKEDLGGAVLNVLRLDGQGIIEDC